MKVESVLGRGAFATVYYCLDISLSRAYAVKVNPGQLRCFIRRTSPSIDSRASGKRPKYWHRSSIRMW